MRLRRRSREVASQRQAVQVARQPRPPVLDLQVEFARVQPCLLPGREVGVLARHRRQFGSAGAGEQRHEFTIDDLHRPAVGDAVVHRDLQPAAAVGEPKQPRPQQRAAGEFESAARLGLLGRLEILLRGDVDHRQHDVEPALDPLARLAVDERKARTQPFVPIDHPL